MKILTAFRSKLPGPKEPDVSACIPIVASSFMAVCLPTSATYLFLEIKNFELRCLQMHGMWRIPLTTIRVNGQFISGLKTRGFLIFNTKTYTIKMTPIVKELAILIISRTVKVLTKFKPGIIHTHSDNISKIKKDFYLTFHLSKLFENGVKI